MDAGKRSTFHKALPLVKRVGVFPGEMEIADRVAFVAGNIGELS